MPDWTDITNTQVEPKAPVTSELMTALRENTKAAMWHPYDEADGVIYDHSDPVTGGNVRAITSPTLEDGHDYMFIFLDLNTDSTSDEAISARLNYDDGSDSGYVRVMRDEEGEFNAAFFELLFPRKGNGYGLLATTDGSFQFVVASATSATAKVETVTLRQIDNSHDIVSGKLIMLKRAERYSEY